MPASLPEHYYQKSSVIPYIDKFIYKLKVRFTNHKVISSNIDSLFQENCHLGDFKNLLETFFEDNDNESCKTIIESEYIHKQTNSKPKNVLGALTLCKQFIYLNVLKFFRNLVTFRYLLLQMRVCFPT